MIAHRPSPIAHRPSPIAHRPSPIAHRPSPIASMAIALLTLLCFDPSRALAQEQDFIPIDHKGQNPSSHIGYLPNKGQLTAMQGGLVPDVLYYSIQCSPQLFLTKKNEIFFQIGTRDSVLATPDLIHRVGLKFVGPNANASCQPNTYEDQSDFYNFVLGHCPNGIYGVHASRRVVYPDLYPGIDLHLYSNAFGPKMYLVMRPGSDPDDLLMEFQGQDSLLLDLFGNLKAYVENGVVILPKGLCYQQIGNATELVSAGLPYDLTNGVGQVKFMFGSYNPEYPLIVDVSANFGAGGGGTSWNDEPEWSTYYGHTETDFANDAAALPNSGLIVCGTTYSPEFPLFAAQFDFFDGGRDAYYSEFNADYKRIYTTLFGGNGVDGGESIQVTPDANTVYLNGRTTSTNLPVLQFGSGFIDNTPDASGNCYVARFSRTSDPIGLREWVTYFGNGIWTCNCMRVDGEGQVHLLGTTDPFTAPVTALTCQGTAGSFPACDPPGNGDFFKGTTSGGADAFYARFDLNSNLEHSTFFGGSATEHGRNMAVDNTNGKVYIVGNTASRRLAYTNCQPPSNGGFPLCNSAGTYFQDDLNVTNTAGLNDGYIAAFDFDGALIWSTYVGSAADETGHVVGLNSVQEVYMAGLTSATTYATSSCDPPTSVGFPNCAQPNQLRLPAGVDYESQYIVKFNASNQLNWTTFVNGYVTSFAGNEGDGVFLAVNTKGGSGGTEPFPVVSVPNRYFQAEHANGNLFGTDVVVMELTGEEEIAYSSYVGGNRNDGGIVVPWIGGRLYLVGSSTSTADFPFHCPSTVDPYCYLSYATQSATTGEAFYAQLQYDVTSGIDESVVATSTELVLFPNPTAGDLGLAFGTAWENAGQVDILIHDALGRVVRTFSISAHSREKVWLPLGDLPKGMYLARIRSKQGELDVSRTFLKL